MISIYQAADGTVTVTDATSIETFSRELIGRLPAGGRSNITLADDVLTIAAVNGTWKYKLDPLSGNRLVMNGLLIEGPP